MLMNECDAPESNNTYAGWESMVNIPAIIGSFYKISSASVKFTYPEQLAGTFFLIIILLPDESWLKARKTTLAGSVDTPKHSGPPCHT